MLDLFKARKLSVLSSSSFDTCQHKHACSGDGNQLHSKMMDCLGWCSKKDRESETFAFIVKPRLDRKGKKGFSTLRLLRNIEMEECGWIMFPLLIHSLLHK